MKENIEKFTNFKQFVKFLSFKIFLHQLFVYKIIFHKYVHIYRYVQPEINFTDVTLDEFCSEFPPLVTQNQAVYNACSTNSLASLQSLQSIASVLNNMKCQNSSIPFFCNGTQVLCGEQNTFIEGLEEMCVQIRNNDCAVEWRAYEMVFYQTVQVLQKMEF